MQPQEEKLIFFYDLVVVPLETRHHRQKFQTQWKQLIFLAPIVGIEMTLVLYFNSNIDSAVRELEDLVTIRKVFLIVY